MIFIVPKIRRQNKNRTVWLGVHYGLFPIVRRVKKPKNRNDRGKSWIDSSPSNIWRIDKRATLSQIVIQKLAIIRPLRVWIQIQMWLTLKWMKSGVDIFFKFFIHTKQLRSNTPDFCVTGIFGKSRCSGSFLLKVFENNS